MQNRLISVVIGLVLILGIGGWVYSTRQSEAPKPEPTPVGLVGNPDIGNINPDAYGTTTSTSTDTGTGSGYTLAEVAKHNSRTSCWSAINGSVYDLTSWIPNHPGGSQAILSICGIDGSSTYNAQHGGESRPAGILAGFKLGKLK